MLVLILSLAGPRMLLLGGSSTCSVVICLYTPGSRPPAWSWRAEAAAALTPLCASDHSLLLLHVFILVPLLLFLIIAMYNNLPNIFDDHLLLCFTIFVPLDDVDV